MSTHWVVVAIAMMSYLLYQYINGGPGNLIRLKASDGNHYLVQDLPNKQEACELMSQIHTNLLKVVSFYKQDEYTSDTPARLLVERFNPSAIMENSVTSSDTSYSENKGENKITIRAQYRRGRRYQSGATITHSGSNTTIFD